MLILKILKEFKTSRAIEIIKTRQDNEDNQAERFDKVVSKTLCTLIAKICNLPSNLLLSRMNEKLLKIFA